IPAYAQARRQIVPPVIELDIAGSVIVVRLFIIPARANVELPVWQKLPVVLYIKRLSVRVRLADEFEVTDAGGVPDDERITKGLSGGDSGGYRIYRQAQCRQRRCRDGRYTSHTRSTRAGNCCR